MVDSAVVAATKSVNQNVNHKKLFMTVGQEEEGAVVLGWRQRRRLRPSEH